MAPVKANTWPPLISGASSDSAGRQQLNGQEILGSAMFEAKISDGFFYPVECALTGFAYDGLLYQNGADASSGGAARASWYTEAPGPWRGDRAAFPQRGVILLTDAGLSILDLDSKWALWMSFLRGDTLAFTHNALGTIAGFVPQEVTYANGRVMVALAPDPGSDFKSPTTLVFDFVQDAVYMDRPAYRAPVPGAYSIPSESARVGSDAGENAPSLDLTDGGAATFWCIEPELPLGLSINPDTGVIYGNPLEECAPTTYLVSAYNPGGWGQTTVDITVLEKLELQARWGSRQSISSTWYVPE